MSQSSSLIEDLQEKQIMYLPMVFGEGEMIEILARDILPEYLEPDQISEVAVKLRGKLYESLDEGDLKTLYAVAQRCRKCSDVEHPAQLPVWNTANPDMVIVTDNPSVQKEDLDVLVDALKEAGFSSKKLCVTFMNRCKTGSNRSHSPDEIKNCMPYLHTEIQLLKPRLILTLGAMATSTLLSEKRFELTEGRGSIYWVGPWAVLPTWSIRGQLRTGEAKKREFFSDVATAFEFVYGKKKSR